MLFWLEDLAMCGYLSYNNSQVGLRSCDLKERLVSVRKSGFVAKRAKMFSWPRCCTLSDKYSKRSDVQNSVWYLHCIFVVAVNWDSLVELIFCLSSFCVWST